MGYRRSSYKTSSTNHSLKKKPRRLNRKPHSRDKYWLTNEYVDENDDGEWQPVLCHTEERGEFDG